MPTQFDTAGMPAFNSNAPVANGLRNTELANPQGDKVDNSAGDNLIDQKAQGLSTAMGGADLGMQSKPSWLY